ncbi:MAG: TonB-dependent receptor plug domain-containing protein [Alphaproteobacteria bacterium]
MKKLHKFLIALFFVTIANNAYSETTAEENFKNENKEIEDPKSYTFNPQIFSLSKKKESAFDSASAIYVLSSEDIRRSGVTSIPEALRLVPGVQVSRLNGHSYAITVRGFQRQFSNKLLVMIDGRTIYNNLFSGVFWDEQDYVLEDIDRIEVIRGPGGAIWGANAVNGVINIITKNASQTKGFYASQIVGNKDQSITEVRYGGETKEKNNYRFYAKTAFRDGLDQYPSKVRNRDENLHYRSGFRYDISSIKNNPISLKGDIYKGVAKNFGIFSSQINDKTSMGGNLIFGWDSKISKKSKTTFNSYFDYHRFYLPLLRRSARTFDVDFQHFYNLSNSSQLTWGLGYRQMQDDIEEKNSSIGVPPLSYTPSWRNDQLFSAFLQNKFSINEKLLLTIGSKFEKNDFTGFEYQPSAKIVYYPSRNQTLWSSVSRVVRTPTRGEDDLQARAPNSTVIVNNGSDIFKAETMIAYEAGYRIKPNHKTLIDLSSFYNQYSKLRTWEGLPNSSATVGNKGKSDTYGFEINAKWQVNNKLLLEVSYDHLKINTSLVNGSTDNSSISSSSDSLRLSQGQSPRNQFRLRSFYNLTSNLEFDNMLYYVDPLPTGAGNTFNQKGLSSYVRFDTRVGYQASKELDLSVGVQDVFDKTHREFKPALYNRQTQIGRTFYLKAVWQY